MILNQINEITIDLTIFYPFKVIAYYIQEEVEANFDFN